MIRTCGLSLLDDNDGDGGYEAVPYSNSELGYDVGRLTTTDDVLELRLLPAQADTAVVEPLVALALAAPPPTALPLAPPTLATLSPATLPPATLPPVAPSPPPPPLPLVPAVHTTAGADAVDEGDDAPIDDFGPPDMDGMSQLL